MTDIKPTEAELEILRVLWHRGEATVREVNEELSKDRKVGYTTTLKLMQIMTDKRLLSRQKMGKLHVYKARTTQTATRGKLLDRMLKTAFEGSSASLVMQLLGNKNTSKEELKKIKDYIEKLEKNQK